MGYCWSISLLPSRATVVKERTHSTKTRHEILAQGAYQRGPRLALPCLCSSILLPPQQQ